MEAGGQIRVSALFTHFADAWRDASFTAHQVSAFLEAVAPYRPNVKIHVANSSAIIKGFGHDFDYVRPGVHVVVLVDVDVIDGFC